MQQQFTTAGSKSTWTVCVRMEAYRQVVWTGQRVEKACSEASPGTPHCCSETCNPMSASHYEDI